MRLYIITLCLAVHLIYCNAKPESVTQLPGYTQLTEEQVNHLQNRGFGETVKTFIPTPAYRKLHDEFDSDAESSQDRAPTYINQNYPVPLSLKSTLQSGQNYPVPLRTTQGKIYSQPTAKPDRRLLPVQQQQINQLEEEEEKEEEPDRLSLLLPQSKFNCNGKHTGYYADEYLSCEVFHYCQENAKHSWICPNGFTFHQVHLICMPPGGDNICDKSSNFHFVNDYLYKPVNLEEYQMKPNVTLKYSDRYYPELYRTGYDDYDEEPAAPIQHQHSVRVPVQQQQQQRLQSPSTAKPQIAQTVPQRLNSPSTIRPPASIGQVFRSPEEINISLQQRRPQYTTSKYDDYYY